MISHRLLLKIVASTTRGNVVGSLGQHRPTTVVLSSASAMIIPNIVPTGSLSSALSGFNVVRRTYRGDSGEASVHTLSPEEEALLKVAQPRAVEIYSKHIELPVDDDDLSNTRRKRLVYRSKQRGWLEVDLLLGTWASTYVEDLTDDELDQFEDFVNMETIDIYNVITLRLDVPDHMKRVGGTGVVERIQEWARSNPLGKADPDAYKSVKTEHKLI